MSLLDGLFSNPAIRKAALSNLVKVMKENNVSQVLVKLNASGELDLEFIKDEQVIISKEDFELYNNELIKKLDL